MKPHTVKFYVVVTMTAKKELHEKLCCTHVQGYCFAY